MSITDIGRESAEETEQQSRESGGYERFDVAGMQFAKQHPTTSVAGDARVLRYFAGDPDNDNLDRGYNGLVMDNPELVADDEMTASVIIENNQDKGDDFKVVDLSDEQTEVMTSSGTADFFDQDTEIATFDDVIGVDFAGNATYGEVRAFISADEAEAMVEDAGDGEGDLEDLDSVTAVQAATLRNQGIESLDDLADADADKIVSGFDTETLIVKLTGNSGRSAAQCLDVCGAGGAGVERDDEGNPIIDEETGFPTYNGSLVEYVDDDSDDEYTPPRYARDTELRPDIEGERVAILLQRTRDVMEDYDGDSYWTTVLTQDDEGSWSEVEPTKEFEPDEQMVRTTGWLDTTYPSDERILEARKAQGIEIDDDLVDRVDGTVAEEADAE